MIEFRNVSVDFPHAEEKHAVFHAVQNVNLQVERGEIYGIVGHSGAGKSTLLRTVNQLQKTTAGEVIVDGLSMGALEEKALNQARRNIGMIFQQSNLLKQLNVADNIAFPLRKTDMNKQEIAERVDELLSLVGLETHKFHYPVQLSGGQSQRVSIARALANNPDILLSDEATSALDPQTTESILELLRHVNKTYGITIVLITHEMDVIKEICDRVAIMQDGAVIEEGNVFDIFTKPQEELTKEFINSASQTEQGIVNILENPASLNLRPDDKLIRIDFSGTSSQTPLIATLAKDYDVITNIHFGNIETIQDKALGTLLVSLSGDVIMPDAGLASTTMSTPDDVFGNVTYDIEIPKGVNVGAYIAENAQWADEDEFLLAAGVEFEVIENNLLWGNTIKLRAIGVNKDHIWYK